MPRLSALPGSRQEPDVRRHPFLRIALSVAAVCVGALGFSLAQAPIGWRGLERLDEAGASRPISVPGGQIHALVVGMDDYKRLPHLRGAVADARDIEQALRRVGVADITTLIDGQATRAALSDAIARIVSRTTRNDLVIISFAGHGSQEPARVTTAENGGKQELFMLAGLEMEGPATSERIRDTEIYGWLSQINATGATTIFVADTCHGGGLSKAVDPRLGGLTYRALRMVATKEEAAASPDAYYIADDRLGVSSGVGEASAAEDLKGLTFVAAVDKAMKAPEIPILGESTTRGVVSYAFARALAGAADTNRDGRTTRRELITYIRDKVHDLTERRQEPVFAPLDRLDDVLFVTGEGGLTAAALNSSSPTEPTVRPKPLVQTTTAPVELPPFRIAVVNGAPPAVEKLGRQGAPFVLAQADSGAVDAVWDLATGDVVSSLGDIIARKIAPAQLAGVVDRLAAVRQLAVLAVARRPLIGLAPDKRSYRAGEKMQMTLNSAAARYVVVADINGNGVVQFVYPLQGDDPMVLPSEGKVSKALGEIDIRPPFGSDVLVAVAGRQRLQPLEELLTVRDQQRAAREFVDLIARLPPSETELGFVSFFSEP